MASPKSRVALLSTEDRKSAVASSIKALNINPCKNKDVLIKPNFNTADLCPGSTHNDTLVALVEEAWNMGAKSVSIGERSYPPTREVMEHKGVIPLMKKLDVTVIDFDELDNKDWVEVKPKDSHWENGFFNTIDLMAMRGFCTLSQIPVNRILINREDNHEKRGE